ncbi:F-box/FBD/LRR-repeat protein At2g04230 [Linum grandiflorum]
MEKQPNELTATVGEDRISRLPDEILHSILFRLGHSKEAGQKIILSKKWRRVWHSYPVVHFDLYSRYSRSDLEKFSHSTIERFSRDSLLAMETLKLQSVVYEAGTVSCPVVDRLLDLASERKAEEIEVIASSYCYEPGLSLPYRVLFNSTVKTLRLSRVLFALDNYKYDIPLSHSHTCLRSLYLYSVEFQDQELLMNLISNSPLLETLQLIRIVCKFSKLQLSTLTNLKKLDIVNCWLEKIEIVAPWLQSLYLEQKEAIEIALIAPQLNCLEIVEAALTEIDLQAIISKLPSLKYLTLHQHYRMEKKLELSSSSLMEFKLYLSKTLEEIELDAGPGLEKVSLHYDQSEGFAHALRKCVISNAGATCCSEVYYYMHRSPTMDYTLQWFVGFKNLVRCNHFHTVVVKYGEFSFAPQNQRKLESEEVHLYLPRGIIEHLKIYSALNFRSEAALVESFFWACRPKVNLVSWFNSLYQGAIQWSCFSEPAQGQLF